jgi:hypothetical protein
VAAAYGARRLKQYSSLRPDNSLSRPNLNAQKEITMTNRPRQQSQGQGRGQEGGRRQGGSGTEKVDKEAKANGAAKVDEAAKVRGSQGGRSQGAQGGGQGGRSGYNPFLPAA